MTRVIGAFCTILVLCVSAYAAEDIADVKTLEDLRAVKPIRLASDWEVRLGISDGGEAAESWRLFYCFAKYVGKERGQSVRMEVPPSLSRRCGRLSPLGPVHYAVVWGRGKEFEGHFGGATHVYATPREALFCGLAPVRWHGVCRLLVFEQRKEPEARLIAERRFDNLLHPPASWALLAKPERGNGQEVHRFKVRPHYFAAWPKYDGCEPVLDLTAWKTPPPRGGTPLPGKLPMGAFWLKHALPKGAEATEGKPSRALKLSLEKDRLVIRSPVRMISDPGHHLLGRWRVNGRSPRLLPTADLKAQGLKSGLPTRETHVILALPQYLGDLKPGDRAALEVLYTPRRFQLVRRPGHEAIEVLDILERLPEVEVVRVPMLSNRIEFVVTQQMLDARKQ
jgi:hypothetical protein